MHLFLSTFLVIFTPLYLFSQTTNIQDIDIEKLSLNTTWLKLLHYDSVQKKSTIITDDFFLSPKGQKDPKIELIATIEAYFETSKTDKNARCKFPARYFWLSKHMELPNYQIVDTRCKKLSNWKMLKDTKSISLVYVSGYLGNPASTFGHSFLKLNRDKADKQENLFDLSVSYGALVPDNELTLLYIYRGLTGGYEAGFSDKYYYIQDLVYSNTEFRDIWDYQLNLTDDDQKLLLFHIWEIIGKKFQYFFSNKNCAYEVSKLLELVVDESIIHYSDYWYAPVETCHSFRDIDAKREETNKIPLINKIRYIPSEQRVIYAHYNSLSKQAKSIVLNMIESQIEHIPLEYNSLSEDKKIEIIDFVLAYYKYLLVKTPDDNIAILHKNKILFQRLQLPIKEKKKLFIKNRVSPDFDNRPISFSSSLSHSSNQGHYLSMRLSPFSVESIGQNTLEGNELTVLDTIIGVNSKEDSIFIDKIDFIKIRNFKTLQMPFDVENPWSWQMNIGAEYVRDEKREYDFFVDSGIGKAWRLDERVMLYSMMYVSGHTIYPYLRFAPNIGIHLNLGKLKVLFSVGMESNLNRKNIYNRLEVESAYKIFKDTAIFFKYRKNEIEKTSIGLQWFF